MGNRNVLTGSVLLLSACSGPSGPLQFDPSHLWLTDTTAATMILGDVNGDNMTDLVLFTQRTPPAPVFVAYSYKERFGQPQRVQDSFCAGTAVCATGDVNGDGRDDILSFVHGDGQQEGSAAVWVALSEGTKFAAASMWNSGFCIAEQECKVGDVNGDKRADIVAYTPKTGLVWVSLSTGAAFGSNGIWKNFFCILGETCALGDVDGDGRSDAVLFKPNAALVQKGNVLWAPSSGTAFGAAQLGHGYFCIPGERCFVEDFDGDKRADIMLLKRPTPWESLVSLSNGTQFINTNPFLWSDAIVGQPVGVADVNGDGRADVVTYDRSGNSTDIRYFVALASSGSAPSPSGPPAQSRGVKRVEFFNCVPEQRDLYYWVTDMTTNAVTTYGPISTASDSLDCPGSGAEPHDVNLLDQHDYRIVAVDPEGQLCGENNPGVLGCQRQVYFFRGDANGATITINVPAVWP